MSSVNIGPLINLRINKSLVINQSKQHLREGLTPILYNLLKASPATLLGSIKRNSLSKIILPQHGILPVGGPVWTAVLRVPVINKFLYGRKQLLRKLEGLLVIYHKIYHHIIIHKKATNC